MTNLRVRMKLLENGLKYYDLSKILCVSDSTRCLMLRNELPDEEQDRICKLIDDYAKGKRGD